MDHVLTVCTFFNRRVLSLNTIAVQVNLDCDICAVSCLARGHRIKLVQAHDNSTMSQLLASLIFVSHEIIGLIRENAPSRAHGVAHDIE